MNYNYMKTNKIAVQGSIDIVSDSQGTLSQDLTGTYDISDIKTLLGDYMFVNLDSSDGNEVGLLNGFSHPTHLDVTHIVIKKATTGFDVDKFNNLLKLLGFSDGTTIYTTDQTFTEYVYDGGHWGIVYSPFMGGKIPLLYSIPNSEIKGGFSTYEPISVKREGVDNVTNNKIHSNRYKVRRGWDITFKGTDKFIELLDTVKDVFKSPNYFLFSHTGALTTSKLYLLPHNTYESRLIYSDIGMYEVTVTFLKGV